jgi:hypothetical protein
MSHSHSYPKYSHDKTFFNKWSESSAYLIGFIEADGCFWKSSNISTSLKITLSEKDKKQLENIKKMVNYTGPILSTDTKCNGKLYKRKCLIITSDVWGNDFKRIGVRTGCIPKMEPEFKAHYIRELFDGDGSIYWEKQAQHFRASIVFGNEKLTHEIAEVLKPITDSKLVVHKKCNSDKCWYIH